MTNFNRTLYSLESQVDSYVNQVLSIASSWEQASDPFFIQLEETLEQYTPKARQAFDTILPVVINAAYWAAVYSIAAGAWYRRELQVHTEVWMEASFMDASLFDSLEEEEGDISGGDHDDDLPKPMSGWTLEQAVTPIVITSVAAYRAFDVVMARRANQLADEVVLINNQLNTKADKVISNIKEEVTNLFHLCRSNIPFNLG